MSAIAPDGTIEIDTYEVVDEWRYTIYWDFSSDDSHVEIAILTESGVITYESAIRLANALREKLAGSDE